MPVSVEQHCCGPSRGSAAAGGAGASRWHASRSRLLAALCAGGRARPGEQSRQVPCVVGKRSAPNIPLCSCGFERGAGALDCADPVRDRLLSCTVELCTHCRLLGALESCFEPSETCTAGGLCSSTEGCIRGAKEQPPTFHHSRRAVDTVVLGMPPSSRAHTVSSVHLMRCEYILSAEGTRFCMPAAKL